MSKPLIQDVADQWSNLVKTYGQKIYAMRVEALLDLVMVKPTVLFTPEAQAKIDALVQYSTIEISWHGLVRRVNPMTYLVYDILVYPQICSAARVTTDDEEYTKWLHSFPDHIFKHIRYQGHSHVKMGTNPSPTDQQYYKDLIKNIKKNDYYIFGVHNKQKDIHLIVYQNTEEQKVFEGNQVLTDTAIGGQESMVYAQKTMTDNVKTKSAKITPNWEDIKV